MIPRCTFRVRPSSAMAGVLAAALLLPAVASGATFAPATPISGVGDEAALAHVGGAALTAAGASAVVGISDFGGRRAPFAAFGTASAPPSAASGGGPPAGAHDLAFAADAAGDVALTYSVAHVAYVTTCRGSTCRPVARVGRSSLEPQPAVAVQPRSGRTVVMWRGRTSRGINRLQWRITTNGRLGATHTLGEFGATPRLGTDATGRTVGAWLADRRGRRNGIRTAARRVGEFSAPRSVTTTAAAALRLTTSERGESVLAWLGGAGAANPEGPVGEVRFATRTGTSAFGAAQVLGVGSTLALAGSPDGHTVLVADRHVGATSVVVAVARRDPGRPFGPLVDVSAPQFVSDVYGASAAVADGGRALVAWASATDPSAPAPQPNGVFAAIAEPAIAFTAPQLLADAQTATLPQGTAVAIERGAALVAWVGRQGGWVARTTG